jgi:LysR family transcriptional regulator, transcriptional activator of nhaA
MTVNFKHLHYFWVTAHAGGILRAGEKLHTTPQTVSSQIKLLEDRLGRKLFSKSGRKLELTEDGRVALRYADDIFNLGGELTAAMREQREGPRTLEFRVGVADSVAKSAAYRLLLPALQMQDPVRMVANEGRLPELLALLAVHRLDLVLADEPLSRRLGVKAFNHELGTSGVSFFCAPVLAKTLRGVFPQTLNGAPMLIHGIATPLRAQFDAWLVRNRLSPTVVGEFDDGALTKEFGRAGNGVFMAPTVLETEICTQYGVQVLGQTDELREQYFAISVERRITHPCVAAITAAARTELFHG